MQAGIKKELLIILKKIKNINYKNININISSKLDSIEMLDLISAVERKFEIKINYSLLNKKHFKNILTLVSLINKIKNDKIYSKK
jgi:acyl carrier protein